MTYPLAYTIRQCRNPQCRKILRWPILHMADACALQYLHCEEPTEFLEVRGAIEEQPNGVVML